MITPKGELLDEAGALSLWNRRNEIPENERPWAQQKMRDYAAARTAAGEHLWPSLEAQKAKANEQIEARWLDGAETPGDTPEEKDLYKEMEAISMISGATGEQISYALPRYRSGVAAALGSPGAENDPKKFQELLRDSIKLKRDKRYLIEGDPKTDPDRKDALAQTAWVAARDQVSEADAYSQWAIKAKDKPGFNAQDNFAAFSSLYNKGKKKWDDYRSRAQMITSVLTEEMRKDTPTIDVAGLLPLLSGLTAEERGSVLSLVKEDAMAKEKNVGQKTGEALARVGLRLTTAVDEMTNRGLTNLIQFTEGQYVNANSANNPQKLVADKQSEVAEGMSSALSGLNAPIVTPTNQVKLTKQQAEEANKEVSKVKEQFKITRELRDIATGRVDPVKSSNRAVDLLYYGGLNFAASMATFAIPGGMALNYNAYLNDEVNRLESLGVSPGEAMAQSLVVAGLQSGLDKIELRLFKKLPSLLNFKESMKAPATTLVKSLMGRVGQGVKTTLLEGVVEGTQQMVPMLTQNMAAAIDKDRKSAEVSELLKEGWTATWETWVSMLPLALIGLGIGGYRDFKGIEKLVSNRDALSKIGFSNEQINSITAQVTPQEQSEYMASIWTERTPVVTAAINQDQQQANNIILDPSAAPGDISRAAMQSSNIEKYSMIDAAMEEAVREAAGGEDIVIKRENNTYNINGTVVSSSNDAMRLLSAMADNKTQKWYSAVDEMISQMSIGRTISMKKEKATFLDEIFTAEEEGQSSNKIENIWNRVQIAASAAGMPAVVQNTENPETIKTLNNMRILGKSITEVKGKVLNSVSTILAGGKIIDLVEENAENDYRESVLAGEITKETMKGALSKLEAVTGIKFMENDTDLGVTEGWSKLVRLYVTGTKSEKGGFAAQAVRSETADTMRRIRQRLREEVGKETVDESLVSKLEAYMGYFKEVLRNVHAVKKARESGELSDVESMIRKSIGLEDKSIAEKEIADIMVSQAESILGESMSVSPLAALDEEYMAAVESGDVAKQQEIVDDAAAKGGFNTMGLHGSPDGSHDVFIPTVADDFPLIGTSITSDPATALRYANDIDGRKGKALNPKVYEVYVKGRVIDIIDLRKKWESLGKEWNGANPSDVSSFALSLGFSMVDPKNSGLGDTGEIIVLDPNLIKSADPVTRDNQGKVIPISQRFNTTNANISYSVSPLAALDEVINRIDEKMASNLPARNAMWNKSAQVLKEIAQNLRTTRVTPDRFDDKGKLIPGRVIPALVEKRSASSIAREASFRAATDYEVRTPQDLDAEQVVRRNAIFRKTRLSELKSERTLIRGEVFNEEFKGKEGEDSDAWNHFQSIKDLIINQGAISVEDAEYIAGESSSEEAKKLLADIRSALKTANAKSRNWYNSTVEKQNKAYAAAVKEAQDWRDAEEDKARGPQSPGSVALAWKKDILKTQAAQYTFRAQLLRDIRVMQAAVASMPSEIRGKLNSVYNVAILSSAPARASKILDELDKINVVIEKHLLKRFQKDVKNILEKSEVTVKKNQVIVGNTTPEWNEFFNRVRLISRMSIKDVDERVNEIEVLVNNENAEYEPDADKINELNDENLDLIVFGGILQTGKFKRNASEVYHAYQQIVRAFELGRSINKAKIEERKKIISEKVSLVINTIGEADLQDAEAREARDKKQGKAPKVGGGELLRIVYNIYDRLEVFLGENHPITKEFSTRIRHSREKARWEQYAETEALNEFISKNFGIKGAGRQAIWLGKLSKQVKGKLQRSKNVKYETDVIPIKVAKNILDGTLKDNRYKKGSQSFSDLQNAVDGALDDDESVSIERIADPGTKHNLDISELEAVFYTMIWQQDRYKPNMEKHGLGADFIEQIENWISPEAKAIREHLRSRYAQEYDSMNAVYRALFDINMPKEDNYARASFDSAGDTDLFIGPNGLPMVNGGATINSIKGRVKHGASPRLTNALAMRMSHVGMISHWKATAELSRDLRAVFGNQEVKYAIKAKFGSQAYKGLMIAIRTLENGGWADAVSNSEGNRFIQRMMPAAVSNGIGGSIGSLMAQGSAAIASASRIGATQYFKQLSKIAANPGILKKIYNDFSMYLRRGGRYTQGQLLTMLTGENANIVEQAIMRVGEMGSESLSVVDATLTTLSGAIAYMHYKESIKGAMGSDAAEEEYAMDKFREAIEATAQPDDFSRKSNFENEIAVSTGIKAIALRTLFFFKSAPRMLSANIFKTIEQIRDGHIDAKTGADRLVAMMILIPLIENSCRMAYKDLFSDEPDEKLWMDWRTWVAAMATSTVSGVPGINLVADFIKVMQFGGYTSSLQDPISRLLTELPKSIKTLRDGKLDMKDLISAMHLITMGTIISDRTGGPLVESAANLLSTWVGWDDGSVLTDGQKDEKYLRMMHDKQRREDRKAIRESQN